MAWSASFPITAGIDIQDYPDVVANIFAAVKERGLALHCHWPRQSHVFESGTVPAGISSTSFTDVSKTWCVNGTPFGTTYDIPWNCTTAGGFDDPPTSWAVIFQHVDPALEVKATITSWTTGGQLNYSDITDYVTSARIASIASLVGRKYEIVGYQKIAEGERDFPWVNARAFAEGTVATYSAGTDAMLQPTVAAPTHVLIRDDTQSWTAGEHDGRDLLLNGDDGKLHRVVITATAKHTLTFATQTWTPAVGSYYVVVDTGKRAVPGRTAQNLYQWYLSLADNYAAHLPDATLGTVPMPAITFHTAGAGPFDDCSGYDENVFDFDLWSEGEGLDMGTDDKDCGRPRDHCYTPDVHKAFPRGPQTDLEEFADGGYVLPGTGGGSRIPQTCRAEIFNAASINSFTGTTGSVTGGIPNNEIAISGVTWPVGMTFPRQVCYSINRPDLDDANNFGRGVMTNSTTLQFETGDAVFDPSFDESRSVIISLGWSRFYERQFLRMFDVDGYFEPDTHTVAGVTIAIDPPTVIDFSGSPPEFGVGRWRKRAKSTKYLERKLETQSYTGPYAGFAWESGPSFVTNEYARYAGDNPDDVNIKSDEASSGTSQFFKDGSDPLVPYYRRAVTCLHSYNQFQNDQDGLTRGWLSEDGSTEHLRCDAKDWNDFGWVSGLLRVESGTASGGSTTSATITLAGSAVAFWSAYRWAEFAGPFVGFTFQILISGSSFSDPAAVIEKRLITSATLSGSTATVHWTEASTSPSGKAFQIEEPKRLNRWKGRTLRVRHYDAGTGAYQTDSTTILGNDKDTLFFTALPWALKKTDEFFIVEPPVGTVWKWNGSAWVVPTGSDATRTGVPSGTAEDFPPSQLAALPTIAKGYGRYVTGDLITEETFDEIYRFNNKLETTKVSPLAWVVDDPTEQNQKHSSGLQLSGYTYVDCAGNDICNGLTGLTPCTPTGCLDGKQQADAAWGTTSNAGGPPHAIAAGTFSEVRSDCHPCGSSPADGCSSFDYDRQYSYGKVSDVCTRIAASAEMFNLATYAAPGDGTGCDEAFDANGDPVALNTWTSFGTASIGSDGTAEIKLGGLGKPNGHLPNGGPCFASRTGYSVTDGAALVTWDFTYL